MFSKGILPTTENAFMSNHQAIYKSSTLVKIWNLTIDSQSGQLKKDHVKQVLIQPYLLKFTSPYLKTSLFLFIFIFCLLEIILLRILHNAEKHTQQVLSTFLAHSLPFIRYTYILFISFCPDFWFLGKQINEGYSHEAQKIIC